MIQRARILVEGRVQGVGYRYNASSEARSLNLVGWTRNLPDGRVELEVEGPEVAVKAMIAWCHEGPRFARVDRVLVTVEDTDAPVHDAFVIRS